MAIETSESFKFVIEDVPLDQGSEIVKRLKSSEGISNVGRISDQITLEGSRRAVMAACASLAKEFSIVLEAKNTGVNPKDCPNALFDVE